MLVFIIAAAVPFGWLISFTRLPAELATRCWRSPQDPVVVLAMVNVLLLFLGCFMETTAILLIVTPTLLPIILAVGIDPVHFGIIISLNLIIGAITPPFGVILFILKDIAQVTFWRLVRAVLPFYIPLGIVLLIITYWPGFVLFVPSLFKRRVLEADRVTASPRSPPHRAPAAAWSAARRTPGRSPRSRS